MNKFVISSGHGKYVRGANGYLDEVNEARKVVDKVYEYLEELNCNVIKYHDNTSKSQKENVNGIVAFHNSKNRELDISVHFNAGTKEIGGVEVLYVNEKHKGLSADVSESISKALGIKDRGAKERTNLGFLNNTNKPAILIEMCFVDCKSNADAYNKNFDKACRAIAETVSGKKLSSGAEKVSVEKPKEKVDVKEKEADALGTVEVLADKLWCYNKPKWDAKDKIVEKGDVFTVVDEIRVEGRRMYKLKSGLFLTGSSKYVKFKK